MLWDRRFRLSLPCKLKRTGPFSGRAFLQSRTRRMPVGPDDPWNGILRDLIAVAQRGCTCAVDQAEDRRWPGFRDQSCGRPCLWWLRLAGRHAVADHGRGTGSGDKAKSDKPDNHVRHGPREAVCRQETFPRDVPQSGCASRSNRRRSLIRNTSWQSRHSYVRLPVRAILSRSNPFLSFISKNTE
jgi:hypothetical protein